MSRPLLPSQSVLSQRSIIQVHVLVQIQQFSAVTQGVVASEVWVSDTEIRYDYDGTIRHFQAFLQDPGVYSRSAPHITYPDGGDALYRDEHILSFRNGPYVDDATGVGYASFLGFLQVQEVEGSIVTISELLTDPESDTRDFTGVYAEQHTCVYRGRIEEVSFVDESSFTVLCVAALPQAGNVYVHELTGTTSVASGDGPKGLTDERFVGEPLPWNDTSTEALARQLFGLVTPITGVLTQSIDDEQEDELLMVLSGQPGSQRTMSKATSGASPNLELSLEQMIVFTDDNSRPPTSETDHGIKSYTDGDDSYTIGWSGGAGGSYLANYDLTHTSFGDVVNASVVRHGMTSTSSTVADGTLWWAQGSFPSEGQRVKRWRIRLKDVEIRHAGGGKDELWICGSIEVPRSVRELLGYFESYDPFEGNVLYPDWVYKSSSINEFVLDLGTTPWFTPSEDIFPSAFHAQWDDSIGDWTGLHVLLFKSYPFSSTSGTVGAGDEFLHADPDFDGGNARPLIIEMEVTRESHPNDWDLLVGTEVLGIDTAVDVDGLVTITGLARGKYGTIPVQHTVGEPITLLTNTHPDTEFFVWVGSMGSTTGMGNSQAKGPWFQNPRDGNLYWPQGNYDIIPDTGVGSTFQSARDLLPEPFGCVIMDSEQLRNTLLGTFGSAGSTGGPQGTPDPFIAALTQVTVNGLNDPPIAPLGAAYPGQLTSPFTNVGFWGWKRRSVNPTRQAGAFGYEDDWQGGTEFSRSGHQGYFPVDSLIRGPGATINRWRVNVEIALSNGDPFSNSLETVYADVYIYPAEGEGVNFGMASTDDPLTPAISLSTPVISMLSLATGTSSWFTIPTGGGNTKTLADFYIEQFDGAGIATTPVGNAAWKGFRVLVVPTHRVTPNQIRNIGILIPPGALTVEFEFNSGTLTTLPALNQDESSLKFTDTSSPGGIKLFSAVGGQDYTGLSDYGTKYSGKGQPINALRYYLSERCGLPATAIDDASFNAAYTDEFEGINTGGSPSNVDVDLVYMEHEFSEGFKGYMATYCFEMMSQIIIQHRQTLDTFFWHVAHDPSTSQIDGLTFEYPTPTKTITQWDNAKENFKSGKEVFTHWKFGWSTRLAGMLNGNVIRSRAAFAEALVAAPVDDFNPAVNDTFVTDTTTARNRYGSSLAPDQFFLGRKSTGTDEDRVIARKMARFYIRESLRMPVSMVTLIGVPWVESYDIEIFDTFYLTLPWWSAQKAVRVLGFSRDFKTQVMSITAVEVEVA